MPSNREGARTSSWEQGASAQRIVGACLDRIAGIETLHDRRVPGSRITIEHIAITPAGVFVIDARRSGIRPPHPRVRGFVRPDDQSFESARDREKVLTKLAARMRAVARTLADAPVPVASALCLVDADGPAAVRAFMVDRVWVGTPAALPSLLARPGLLDDQAVQAVVTRLAERLPAG